MWPWLHVAFRPECYSAHLFPNRKRFDIISSVFPDLIEMLPFSLLL